MLLGAIQRTPVSLHFRIGRLISFRFNPDNRWQARFLMSAASGTKPGKNSPDAN